MKKISWFLGVMLILFAALFILPKVNSPTHQKTKPTIQNIHFQQSHNLPDSSLQVQTGPMKRVTGKNYTDIIVDKPVSIPIERGFNFNNLIQKEPINYQIITTKNTHKPIIKLYMIRKL